MLHIIFRVIWCMNGPHKIQCFLWKLCHESLLTNRNQFGWKMTYTMVCHLCNASTENHFHALRDCCHVKEVRNVFFPMVCHLCSVIEVELWGILHGLKIARGRSFRQIQVYSNSYTTIQILWNGCSNTHPISYLVKFIL